MIGDEFKLGKNRDVEVGVRARVDKLCLDVSPEVGF